MGLWVDWFTLTVLDRVHNSAGGGVSALGDEVTERWIKDTCS